MSFVVYSSLPSNENVHRPPSLQIKVNLLKLWLVNSGQSLGELTFTSKDDRPLTMYSNSA